MGDSSTTLGDGVINTVLSQTASAGTCRNQAGGHLQRLVCVLACVLACWGCAGVGHAQVDQGFILPQPNRPELSKPIADQKLVIAHYMTGMIPTPEGETGHWMSPDLYDPQGSTAKLGGIFQTLPVPMLLYPDLLPMKDAALLEMRTAKTLGVDGFNFYYPFGPDDAFRDRYDRFILSFFEAAKENNLEFKLTLCISPLGGNDMTTEQKARVLGEHLRGLLEKTDNSENWLRTPDGKLLIYTWLADAIVNEDLQGKHWEIYKHQELLQKAAAVFDKIAEHAGTEAVFLYHLDQPNDPKFVEKVLDYFPAVYGWCSVGEDLKVWKRVAEQCKARGRTYIQEVHPAFYGSKVHPVDSWAMIFDHQRAVEMGVDQLERHIQITGLSQTFRDKLQMAIDLDSPLINLTTWNDYPEGHHLAPEINHNFGFAILLKHYLEAWRGSDEALSDDTVIVFFKKYQADVKPDPYDIKVRVMRAMGEPEVEDGVEVVTLLSKPGKLYVNHHEPRDVPAGLTVTRYEIEPGAVTAVVKREGQAVASLTTPEWITGHPFRTDRLTYSFSSEFNHYYELIYGEDAPKHTSMQYADDEDGRPLWQSGVQTEYRPADAGISPE